MGCWRNRISSLIVDVNRIFQFLNSDKDIICKLCLKSAKNDDCDICSTAGEEIRSLGSVSANGSSCSLTVQLNKSETFNSVERKITIYFSLIVKFCKKNSQYFFVIFTLFFHFWLMNHWCGGRNCSRKRGIFLVNFSRAL